MAGRRAGKPLSAAGRDEAVRIGRAFQSIGVPIGEVFALPLCRTRETAELAFGRATLKAQLYDARFVSHMLADPPTEGTNTVLVDIEDQVRCVAGIPLRPGGGRRLQARRQWRLPLRRHAGSGRPDPLKRPRGAHEVGENLSHRFRRKDGPAGSAAPAVSRPAGRAG